MLTSLPPRREWPPLPPRVAALSHLVLPQLLGRWTVRSRVPRLGRGGTVLGEGPGVRPCSGSDSQRPPLAPKEGTWWAVDIRGRCWLLFRHQARDRTGGIGTGGSQNHSKPPAHSAPASPPARSRCPRPTCFPAHHPPTGVPKSSKPYHSGPPGQST